MLAIIGGTGLTQIQTLHIRHRQVSRTPYGEPSGTLTFGHIKGREVIFIARHGYGYTIPPHQINYRANLWALHEQQVERVISISAVSGIRNDLGPGVLALPSQILDYTHGRKQTYCDGEGPLTRIDFTEPYSASLRLQLKAAAAQCGQSLVDGGVYAVTQGPRLESAAEINRIAHDGGDLVGMTAMPEAALARELKMDYATLAVVSNWAAGRASSARQVDLAAAQTTFQQAIERVHTLLEAFVLTHGDTPLQAS